MRSCVCIHQPCERALGGVCVCVREREYMSPVKEPMSKTRLLMVNSNGFQAPAPCVLETAQPLHKAAPRHHVPSTCPHCLAQRTSVTSEREVLGQSCLTSLTLSHIPPIPARLRGACRLLHPSCCSALMPLLLPRGAPCEGAAPSYKLLLLLLQRDLTSLSQSGQKEPYL